MESLEGVGHGDVGNVGRDVVLLAEGLKLSPRQAVEVHGWLSLLLFLLLLLRVGSVGLHGGGVSPYFLL